MAIAKRLYFDLPGFGTVHTTDGNFTLAGEKREGVVSDLGPAGFTKEYQYGELKFKIPNSLGISIKRLHAIENQDVNVVDDNGKAFFCSGCFVSDLPTLSSGEIDVTMMYATMEEIT